MNNMNLSILDHIKSIVRLSVTQCINDNITSYASYAGVDDVLCDSEAIMRRKALFQGPVNSIGPQ